ncbi:MAG: nitrogen fixation protein NifZ [Gammaproteobacteria bacterium]|nr:nitrogen fixation protein NifZ [Gammaproteobacteria bacterium]
MQPGTPAAKQTPRTSGTLQPGCRHDARAIHNDGSLPDHDAEALLVPAGGRGVIVNIGHLEQDPRQVLYLVRFEGEDGVLGPPVGCWPQDLHSAPPAAS